MFRLADEGCERASIGSASGLHLYVQFARNPLTARINHDFERLTSRAPFWLAVVYTWCT